MGSEMCIRDSMKEQNSLDISDKIACFLTLTVILLRQLEQNSLAVISFLDSKAFLKNKRNLRQIFSKARQIEGTTGREFLVESQVSLKQWSSDGRPIFQPGRDKLNICCRL